MRLLRRDERGTASLEFVGLLPYLLIAAIFAWQLLVAAYTAVSAENAARNGSRVEGRGGDGRRAAIETLAPVLREHATATVDDEETSVRVEIPIVFPAFTNEDFVVTRHAELPATS